MYMDMEHSVQFERTQENDSLVIGPPKPISAADRLMRLRVIHDPGEAMMIIAGVVSLLIGVSIYLLASSVPPVELNGSGAEHGVSPAP